MTNAATATIITLILSLMTTINSSQSHHLSNLKRKSPIVQLSYSHYFSKPQLDDFLAEMFHICDDPSECSWATRQPCQSVPQCICTSCDHGTRVQCDSSNLTHIPEDLPPNTVVLNLRNNLISDISADTLQNYEKLTKLDISNNKLTHLKQTYFKGLNNLKILILGNNNLTYIENGSFSGLTQICKIDLSYNVNLGFQILPNISYGLERTNISIVNITKIQNKYAECVQIKASDLYHANKTSIKYIILDSNKLVSLTPAAVPFIPHSLKGISVRDNKFSFGAYLVPLMYWMLTSNNMEIFIMSQQNTNHIVNDILLTLYKTKFRTETRIKNSTNRIRRGLQTGMSSMPSRVNSVQQQRIPFFCCNSCRPCQGLIPFLLPKNLKYLDISDDRMRAEVKHVCFCEPNNLQHLKINRNAYWNLQGPITGLTNLQTLDASWNSCSNMSQTLLHYTTNLQTLNLSRNFLGFSLKKDANGVTFQNLANLQHLDLSDNKIYYLPYNIFLGLSNLHNLSLADNQLMKFQVQMKHLKHLRRVDLKGNFLHELDEPLTSIFDTIQSQHQLAIDLSNNQFECSCSHLNFLRWLSETKVHLVDKHTYTCVFSNGTDGNLTFARQIYERLSTECSTYSTLIASTTSILVLFLIIVTGAIVYRYRWNLQYMYYSAKIKYKGYTRFENEEMKFDFDVFVSYCDTEGMFVRQQIIPELEEKRQVHLLIHERDFLPGNFVADNIMRAITTSRKVLIILSKNYLRSTWCRYEMNMSRMEQIATGRDVICVLLKESIPSKNLPLEVIEIIKNQTYVELPKEQQDLPHFWDRMKTALLD